MNIVVVTPSWPQDGHPNGIVTYYTHLIPALIAMGHSVYIVTFRSSDQSDNVQVIDYVPSFFEKLWCRAMDFFSVGYSQYYLGAKSIVDAIGKIKSKVVIDVVQMEDSFGWHYLVQQYFSFPIVMRLHGPYFLNSFEKETTIRTKNRIKREERAFLAAQFVTSPSSDVLNRTKERYGQNWRRSKVIYNAMDVFDQKKQWDFKGAAFKQLLFVGRFDNHKGGDIVLHAFFKVRESMPEVRLIFIGPDKGLEESGEILNVSQFLAKHDYDSAYGESVQFLGQQGKQSIDAYRCRSHVTIVASRYETFGNVALEAIACGSPLVCADSGALPEIIQDGESGLLFESGNSEALAEKLTQLLISDELLLSISRGGLSRAESMFSPECSAAITAEYFESIIFHQAC